MGERPTYEELVECLHDLVWTIDYLELRDLPWSDHMPLEQLEAIEDTIHRVQKHARELVARDLVAAPTMLEHRS